MSRSLFAAVELAPRDPILGLNEAFAADPRPQKVNLGVGVYYDEEGRIPLLASVKTAEEARVVAAQLPPRSTVVLVTSAFHLPRAKRLFERQGLQVLPFPVDFQARGAWAGHPLADPLNWIPSADGLERSSRALREAIGRTLYRAW